MVFWRIGRNSGPASAIEFRILFREFPTIASIEFEQFDRDEGESVALHFRKQSRLINPTSNIHFFVDGGSTERNKSIDKRRNLTRLNAVQFVIID